MCHGDYLLILLHGAWWFSSRGMGWVEWITVCSGGMADIENSRGLSTISLDQGISCYMPAHTHKGSAFQGSHSITLPTLKPKARAVLSSSRCSWILALALWPSPHVDKAEKVACRHG